ncbi:BgTH12-07643, partial [Blumeria graminis f. sp. triticale]
SWVLQILNTEIIGPLIHPPWLKSETRYNSVRRVTHPPINLPSGIPFRDLAVYTDGARSEIVEWSRTDGGIIVFQAGQMVYRESLSLDSTLSPFDTEVNAVKEALKAALSLPTAHFSENIWILTDNLEVARLLFRSPICSSQVVFQQIQALSQDWPLRTRLPHIPPEKVKAYWIPSHSDILGNVFADASAREGLSEPPPIPRGYVSFDTAQNCINVEISTVMKDYWDRHAPVSYMELAIDSYSRHPKELSLARPFLSRLYAARSGRGDFAEYHRRFNHEGANLHCDCGQLKAPLHFLECHLITHRPPRAPLSSRDPKKFLPGTWEGVLHVAKWISLSEFYLKTCPRIPREGINRS